MKTSRLSAILLSGVMAGCGGGTAPATQEGDREGIQRPESFLTTSGSTCACNTSAGVSTLTRECFQSSYGCAPESELFALADPAARSAWLITKQEGCGLVTYATAWGACIYDAATHQLTYGGAFSDVEEGPCGSFGAQTGNYKACTEGVVCSFTGSDHSCVAACSMEALQHKQLINLKYDLSVSLYDQCGGLEPGQIRPELHRGCGRITAMTASESESFDAETHEPLYVHLSNELECNGAWGTAPPPCPDETVCSLCEGDPNVCSL